MCSVHKGCLKGGGRVRQVLQRPGIAFCRLDTGHPRLQMPSLAVWRGGWPTQKRGGMGDRKLTHLKIRGVMEKTSPAWEGRGSRAAPVIDSLSDSGHVPLLSGFQFLHQHGRGNCYLVPPYPPKL